MTHTKKLQGKMREKGIILDTLSSSLNLSKTGLFNKIHNKSEFLFTEVQKIKEILKLDDKEVQEIFFAQKKSNS